MMLPYSAARAKVLQAAAVDLYEALKMLHDDCADYARLNKLGGFNNHAMRAARAAIATADGIAPPRDIWQPITIIERVEVALAQAAIDSGSVQIRADTMREFIAAIRADAIARQVPQWQPIETAPKMRTILLFAVTDRADDGTIRNYKTASGSWHTGYDDMRFTERGITPWTWDGVQLRIYDHQPTHWMPLPAPPAITTESRTA